MIIIGAGMAGLLAGGMIRNQPVTIYEAASELPNNHSAVLRFRSSVVGDTLGIEFKKVRMMKAVDVWRNPVADALAYSMKCNGTATLRSLVSVDGSIQERFIAPENLIEQMAARVNGTITYGAKFQDLARGPEHTVISTIPMPALMEMLAYPEFDKRAFRYVHGYNINVTLPECDAYASVYVPSPEMLFNRVSLTGSRLTIEHACPLKKLAEVEHLVSEIHDADLMFRIECALEFLGIVNPPLIEVGSLKITTQKFAKILPIPEDERKKFIMWASEKHGIYSLGRFATWRPGLLLDDVVNDVRVIQRLINGNESKYNHVKG